MPTSLDQLVRCAGERRLLLASGCLLLPLWPAADEGGLCGGFSVLSWPMGKPERVGLRRCRPDLLASEPTSTTMPSLSLTEPWTAGSDWGCCVVLLAERLAVAKRWRLPVCVVAVREVVDHVEAIASGSVNLETLGPVPLLPLTSVRIGGDRLPRWSEHGWTDIDTDINIESNTSHADHVVHGDQP